jgi:hypothetical protein
MPSKGRLRDYKDEATLLMRRASASKLNEQLAVDLQMKRAA